MIIACRYRRRRLPFVRLAGRLVYVWQTFRRFTPLLPGERNMNFIIWLVVGGLIGWVASMIMRTDGQQGIFLNIIVGIVGAFLGGWLISPLVGVPTINQN